MGTVKGGPEKTVETEPFEVILTTPDPDSDTNVANIVPAPSVVTSPGDPGIMAIVVSAPAGDIRRTEPLLAPARPSRMTYVARSPDDGVDGEMGVVGDCPPQLESAAETMIEVRSLMAKASRISQPALISSPLNDRGVPQPAPMIRSVEED
jgi:hypothetical protein